MLDQPDCGPGWIQPKLRVKPLALIPEDNWRVVPRIAGGKRSRTWIERLDEERDHAEGIDQRCASAPRKLIVCMPLDQS
jgi:hypothetical protein